jgi:peptidoglycan/xylan/chitin deacetylase (PgdA/CDA1 family)
VNAGLPPYYSRLEPFREALQSGGGALTYHHVGPRPAGVRLKGLYVSPKLFGRQITELRDSGFTTEPYGAFTNPPRPGKFNIAITFDDGFRDVLEHALPVLRAAKFSAIQFLVADLIGQTSQWQAASGERPGRLMDREEIKDWLAAGNQIGSHTLRHPFLTKISLAEAQEEIAASRKKLEDWFGISIEHFCYPYGDWNTRVRNAVEAAGYQTACTTVAGVNTSEVDRFALRRFTARYPSRNLKNLLDHFRRRPRS